MKARFSSSHAGGFVGGAEGAGATAICGGPKMADTRRLPTAKPAPSFIACPKEVLEATETGGENEGGAGATCADEVLAGTDGLEEDLELEEDRGIPASVAEKWGRPLDARRFQACREFGLHILLPQWRAWSLAPTPLQLSEVA